MEGYFKTISNKDLADISKASNVMTVGNIANYPGSSNPVNQAFVKYLETKKDIKNRSPFYQVSEFINDMNYEIRKRFEALY